MSLLAPLGSQAVTTSNIALVAGEQINVGGTGTTAQAVITVTVAKD
jgi:hypothetical protein